MAAELELETQEVVLDCEQGRARGCYSYCCRLIVRLGPGESEPGGLTGPGKRCVDKDPKTGYCVHFDRPSGQCGVWERRPQVCREYDCNEDPLLGAVIELGSPHLGIAARLSVGRRPENLVRRLPTLPSKV
jgi:hypothetical protein